MELVKNRIEYKYGAEELHLEMKVFISDVKQLIAEKNYELRDNSSVALKEYESINWETYFNGMSRNMRKKFNKYLRGYSQKRNIHKANLLFHFIHTRVLAEKNFSSFKSPDWINKVVIRSSVKEQAIQDKRKVWVEARDKALQALEDYKNEKGNFYK